MLINQTINHTLKECKKPLLKDKLNLAFPSQQPLHNCLFQGLLLLLPPLLRLNLTDLPQKEALKSPRRTLLAFRTSKLKITWIILNTGITCYLCGPHITDYRRLLQYSNKASGINLLIFLSVMKFVKSNPFLTLLLGDTASCMWAHCAACSTTLTISCATEWLKKNKWEKCRSSISSTNTVTHFFGAEGCQ